MKFSVYTASTPEYNIEETAAVLKELGYDAVEWRVDNIGCPGWMPTEMAEAYEWRYWAKNNSTLDVNNIMADALRAKKASDEAGLEIVALSTSLDHRDGEKLNNVLAAAKAIGCKKVRACCVLWDAETAGNTVADEIAALRAGLTSLEPKLKECGVKLLLETHHGTLTASPTACRNILEGFDPEHFGLIYDPGNMVCEGYEAPAKAIQILGPYLAHVHMKNCRLDPAGTDEFGAVTWAENFVGLKLGMANLNALIQNLVKAGYDDVLSIEDFSNELPTYEKLKDNNAYLRSMVAAAKK